MEYLAQQFPHKKIKSFDLRKSNTDPRQNALHLDCCFQPVGKDKAILHKNGGLTADEWAMIREHPAKGERIMQSLRFLDRARPIVLHQQVNVRLLEKQRKMNLAGFGSVLAHVRQRLLGDPEGGQLNLGRHTSLSTNDLATHLGLGQQLLQFPAE